MQKVWVAMVQGQDLGVKSAKAPVWFIFSELLTFHPKLHTRSYTLILSLSVSIISSEPLNILQQNLVCWYCTYCALQSLGYYLQGA